MSSSITSTEDSPKVLIAILAKNKEYCIKEYLSCILSQDYPKKRIVIYIRANNCTDKTATLLQEWQKVHKDEYLDIISDYADVKEDEENKGKGEHDWNPSRFAILGNIRQKSMELTLTLGCDYYFVVDCDNFITPDTLSSLVSLNLDYVGPLLRTTKLTKTHPFYANIHHECDRNGYYADSKHYMDIINRELVGIIKCKVVHTCYLISKKAIPHLKYVRPNDKRHEYVIFAESARFNKIDQFIDNRKFYGCLVFDPEEMKAVTGDFRIKCSQWP